MRRKFLSEAQKYIKKNRNHRVWRNVVIALACVVVFCTTYALILPAITTEQDTAEEVVGGTVYEEVLKQSREGGSSTDNSGTTNTNPTNFADFITSITLQRKNGNTWEDLEQDSSGNYIVSKDDQISFDIKYELPKGTLNGNSTIEYQLPTNIQIKNEQGDSVYNSSGEEVGKYVIDKSGKITITFYDEYVTKNANSPIEGHISFDTSVDSISFGTDGKVTLPFKDGININFVKEKEEEVTQVLTVEKENTEIDNKKGTVKYTIKVSSTGGTNGNKVTLNDIMNGIVYNGDFEISKNGVIINDTEPTINNDNKGFNITLPAMEDKDVYEITYVAKLEDEFFNGTVEKSNQVTVTAGDKLNDQTEVKTKFTSDLIKKQGEVDGDSIKWTIVINQSGKDISHCKLSDILNGHELENKTVNISPAIKGKNQITLPYEFPEGTKGTYTITYTTDKSKDLGNDQAINKAILENPDKDQVSSGDIWVWIGGDKNDPLSKSAGDVTYKENKTATINWKISIDTSEGELAANWILKDKLDLNNGAPQWFTSEQKDKIEQEISDEFVNYGFTSDDYEIEWINEAVTIDNVSETKTVGFKITFKKTLPKMTDTNKLIEINYESTGYIGEGDSSKKFKNVVDINNEKVIKSDETTYEPVVSKYDLYNNEENENSTTHSYTNLKDENLGDGILKWGFKIKLSNTVLEKDLIITETLPKGVTLLNSGGLKFVNGDSDVDFTFAENQNTSIVQIDGVEVKATKSLESDGTTKIIIEVPKALTNKITSKNLKFKVNAKIDNNVIGQVDGNGYQNYFENKVKVENKDGQILGEDSQTQTIKREVIDKGYGTIKNNIIPYSIEINEQGLDLLEGSDILYLNDEIKCEKWQGATPIDISLVPNSLKVYKIKSDGTEEKIDVEYTYNMEIDSNGYEFYKLVIKIPDKTHLRIEYKYKVFADIGVQRNVINKAYLNGNSEESFKDESKIYVTVEKSQAEANIKGVNIFKVDEDNTATRLQGAKFNLYYWDGTEYKPIKDGDSIRVYETDESGNIPLELEYNTAYKLVEIKAPDKYLVNSEPYYFCIANSDKEKYPNKKPDGFTGKEYAEGSSIYISNKKNITQINVNKKWFKYDDNGNKVEASGKTGSSISFELLQTATTKDSSYKDVNSLGEYIIQSTDHWELTINNLPKQGTVTINQKEEIVYYTYSVKENKSTNYDTTYENNGGIASGTITIKNTLKENPEYVLPETGRFGGNTMFILGGGLLMAGSLVYIYRRKHNKGDVK